MIFSWHKIQISVYSRQRHYKARRMRGHKNKVIRSMAELALKMATNTSQPG